MMEVSSSKFLTFIALWSFFMININAFGFQLESCQLKWSVLKDGNAYIASANCADHVCNTVQETRLNLDNCLANYQGSLAAAKK